MHPLGAGVADEQRADPRLLEDAGGQGVVAGEHRPALAAIGRGLQVADSDPPAGGPGCGLGHGRTPSGRHREWLAPLPSLTPRPRTGTAVWWPWPSSGP